MVTSKNHHIFHLITLVKHTRDTSLTTLIWEYHPQSNLEDNIDNKCGKKIWNGISAHRKGCRSAAGTLIKAGDLDSRPVRTSAWISYPWEKGKVQNQSPKKRERWWSILFITFILVMLASQERKQHSCNLYTFFKI